MLAAAGACALGAVMGKGEKRRKKKAEGIIVRQGIERCVHI
jgi:hypothetical protein